jgi:succinate-semialdehyde dehydrogenase/glutarate-semialdehyde dehydrogenase
MKLKDPTIFRRAALVGDKWIEAEPAYAIEVRDPATGAMIGLVPKLTASETREAIAAAQKAQKQWAAWTAKRRSGILRRWFELLTEDQDDLARILTLEQGKPLPEAKGEIAYGASFIEWFAEEADVSTATSSQAIRRTSASLS